jgi:hypothetical protein
MGIYYLKLIIKNKRKIKQQHESVFVSEKVRTVTLWDVWKMKKILKFLIWRKDDYFKFFHFANLIFYVLIKIFYVRKVLYL